MRSRVSSVVAGQGKRRQSFVVSAQTLRQKGSTFTPFCVLCFVRRFCISYSVNLVETFLLSEEETDVIVDMSVQLTVTCWTVIID